MDAINRQIAQARRRLTIGRFLRAFSWAIFAGLMLAVVGLGIPRIWYLDFLPTQRHHDAWTMGWLVGGGLLGLLVAGGWAVAGRHSRLNAAAEIDRRFGLKERLSSSVAMSPVDAEAAAGRALLADATRSAETIDVRDQFPFEFGWKLLLPLIPVLLLFILALIPNAEKPALATEPDVNSRARREVAIKEFKKKLESKKKELVTSGLKDAKLDLESLEKKFDQLLDDKSSTKKDALIKLNDVRKQIADRQMELGSSEKLKESLNRLKDVGDGLARKISDAISDGDLKQAQQAINDLADKIKSGKLSKAEQKQLVKDLEAIAQKLRESAEKQEREKQDLKDQIQRAIEQGDLDKAAKLQEKLEQKQQQDQQMKQFEKMADTLNKCSDCMKPGQRPSNQQSKQGQSSAQSPGDQDQQPLQAQMDEAAQSLEDLADQLGQMQQELDEMETLEELQQIAQQCQAAMNADGQGDEPKWQDFAQGNGRGAGKRDINRNDTGTFKSRVKARLQRGETVVTGKADGANISGRSVSEARELIQSTMTDDFDPLENQQLPRAQREHARQYFEALRETE